MADQGTERDDDAEDLYLSGMWLAADGIAPQGCGMPPMRQYRHGADEAGL